MEILQYSLKKTDLETLTDFQLSVWCILESLLKKLIFDKLSKDSVIEMGGLGIDVLLRLKTSYFVLYVSIQKDNLILNSEYFDIYVYPETKIDKIEHLLKQVLLGQYSLKLSYGKSEKLVYKELVFDDARLEEFSESQKVGFLTRKIENKKNIEGVKLIDD